MEPAHAALSEARLARETTATALARYRAALEQIDDLSERLRLTGYASIAVALRHNGRDPTRPLVLLGMATA